MPHVCWKITPAFYQWPTLACSGWHPLSPFISWAHPWSRTCCEHSGLWDSRLNCPTLDTDGMIKHRGQVSCSAATFSRSFNCLLTLGSGLSFHRATKPGGSEGRQAPLWKHWVIRSQLSFLNHRTGKMHTQPPTSSSVHAATLQLWFILTKSRSPKNMSQFSSAGALSRKVEMLRTWQPYPSPHRRQQSLHGRFLWFRWARVPSAV